MTTIPESADEVEVVDEADEEEQCSRDSAEFELYPETKRNDNYISGEFISACNRFSFFWGSVFKSAVNPSDNNPGLQP